MDDNNHHYYLCDKICYLLSQHRKAREKKGKFYRWPYNLHDAAFNSNKATILFLVIMIIASITVGNLVQVNSLSIPLDLIDVPVIVGGIVMAVVFFIITTLGLSKVRVVISAIIPFMAIGYLVLCSIILFKFHHNVLPSIQLIVSNFLTTDSFKSGLSLSLILEMFTIIQVGTLRGIFATDIGLSLEGIVHSSVVGKKNNTKFIIQQSLITIISPFIVALIAFTTTMVLLVTGPLG